MKKAVLMALGAMLATTSAYASSDALTKFFSFKNAVGKATYEECIFRIGVPTSYLVTSSGVGGWFVTISSENVVILREQGRYDRVVQCGASKF